MLVHHRKYTINYVGPTQFCRLLFLKVGQPELEIGCFYLFLNGPILAQSGAGFNYTHQAPFLCLFCLNLPTQASSSSPRLGSALRFSGRPAHVYCVHTLTHVKYINKYIPHCPPFPVGVFGLVKCVRMRKLGRAPFPYNPSRGNPRVFFFCA